jgi:hypothetical protein
MVNFAYRAARAQGAIGRTLYHRLLPRIISRPLKQSRKIPLSVYSFSGEFHLPEQVASIRSFIHHVGIPDNFTVVSDGSYSKTSRELLGRISDCINVVDWDVLATNLPQQVKAYAEQHPMGKKLAILMSIPVSQPTIYTDSDILFFQGADELINVAESNGGPFWYLPDCLPSLDTSILYDEDELKNPVNAGFMLLKKSLNWSEPLHRLAEYKGTPIFQTEQTLVHLAMHQGNASPLCPDRFILSLSDQFIYRDHYAKRKIALRHYVNNVRHKFWQNVMYQGS